MASRKPNGTYLARVRTSEGKRVSYVFDTEPEALEWERQAKLAVKEYRAIPDPRSSSSMTVLDFFTTHVDYLWPDSNNIDNLRAQAKTLAEFFGATRSISTITNLDAISFRESMMKKQRAGSTLNNYAANFNRHMNHAVKLGYMTTAPQMEYSKQRKGKIRFLTEGEEERLITYFKFIGRDDYANLVTLLIYTGARISEVLNVKWDDVNDRVITFWDTKSGNPRSVPLTRKAKDAIADIRSNTPSIVGLFTFGYQTFKTAFDKAVEACELDNVTPHTLRHTCATRLVQRGVDIRRVKDWLGHESIQTTMIYAHLAPADLFSAADVLDSEPSVTKLVTKR